MVEGDSQDVNQLCRICSTELKGKGVGIFSPECMDNLVGEKIRRYLYFSVSIKDSLPKMVCRNCLKKLENIHRFAKMAAEMQEKFRVLLSSKGEKPRIKIKTLDDINRQVIQNEVKMNEETIRPELENVEVNLGMAINDLQDVTQDVSINETITKTNKIVNETVEVSKKGQAKDVVKERKKKLEKSEKSSKVEAKIKIEKNEEAERKEPNREVSRNFALVNGNIKVEKKGNSASGNTEEEADTSDSDKLVIQDDEKSNPSLLHCLLVKGKQQQMSMDMDHDYLEKANNNETIIKKEPADPEDEDIADEIVEDRLNQIIKDEMESESEHESELDKESDIEVTEMEVKVDPTLYFSNASQSGNEIEHDSQDEQDLLTIAEVTCSDNNSILHNDTITTVSVSEVEGTQQNIKASLEITPPIMTRHQQKTNPVIASLKMGKPYKCTLCPRSFITDIGLQNHLWSHLPKSRKASKDGIFIPKKVDLEESQVYSSNGVLHTAAPSENPLLLKYICPICGKKISTKGNLKVHLETHRPKGKYGCDICGRVFKTATNLFRHKDYHGGVQYPCPVCGRVYPTNSTLRAHSITHSDLRPHKCPLCSKTFKRNQDLKFHINQHTGARPYQCPYCPKAFASSGNCFSHRKRMHPLEVERDKERAAEIMG